MSKEINTIDIKHLRECVMKSDSETLIPLKNLFMFIDILNENYKKEFGENSPYLEDYVTSNEE